MTDCQLNLLVTEGKVGTAFTLSSVDIDKVSRHPEVDPTIWVGGDSTVASYSPTGGQIARGFRNDGQLEAILRYIKPGDLFLLEMGINDTAAKNATTEAEFKERDMVRKVAATGATPALVTPQGRATDFVDGVHTSVNRWYRNSTVALPEEEGVHLVDLNVLASAFFTKIGPDATLALFMTGDTLHPNRAGASELARLVAEDLSRQGLQGRVAGPGPLEHDL